MCEKSGKRRTVWLPTRLDKKAEEVREELGLGLSAFYRFAVVELVKQFQLEKIERGEMKSDGKM